MLGASSVAIYSVPMTLAMRAQIIATALARTLFPRNSRSSLAEAIDTTRRATVSLTYGFGMVCGPAILVCGPFLKLWIGSRFAEASQSIAQILLFGGWWNGIAFLPYGFIQARGKPHITAKVGLVEVLPYFGVLWFLIDHMGLPGAAIAWAMRVTINCVVLYILSGCIPKNLWRVLPAVVLMITCLLIAQLVPMTPIAALGSAVVIGLTFALFSYYLDPMAQDIVLNAGRRIGILRQPVLLQRDTL